ncbi:MAG: alpha-L-arabinofuranosidase C-terminal domain-containing protein [bacterium]
MHNKKASVCLAAVLLMSGWVGRVAAQSDEPTATLCVNLLEEKAPVSPTLYGIFMEEISHAFDGGIYAELIQNRSFEEGVLPPGLKLVQKPDGGLKMELDKLPDGVPTNRWDMPWPWFMGMGWDTNRALIGWSLRQQGGGKGEMKLTEANPMNAASSRSLELSLSAEGDGGVDLINSGYWGINVQAGTAYDLKVFVRPGTFKGEASVMLEGADGKTLAVQKLGALRPGKAWQKLTAKLNATGTDPQARFVLRLRGSGQLQVDWVSLFPPTYKNRPNGLRPDLAKHLEALKPSFIRYPGGCYVEGYSWAQAPDWRKMVCPPEERPGMWGYWQYRSTDGFGYHEFLQFCEDVGADGLYVAFAGMTCHPDNNWPLDQIDPVIQQTLDAIEYAVGPATSKWGAARAKMGHPKPFPLKYVEIGNEHPPALYGDYYKKFRTAIKAKYPSMSVIMSMYWSGLNPGAIARAGDDNIDMVDEHSYKPSGWIRTNFDYFDKYPRKPWKIYVGEYAHHHNSGDWSAAMDDSVYLMMLERNGDLVKLASYAPLFVNVNHRSWGVNLIEFDSSRSFAHASYYMQKVFGETRPDVNLATAVDVRPKPDADRPLFAGRFGLGSWNTLNEFKEFRIYDPDNTLVFSDDFANGEHWDTPGIGQWKAESGVMKQTDPNRGPTSLFLKQDLKVGRVTLKARRVGGNEGFLMFFNASGPERYMFCNYGAAGNQFSAIQGTPADGIATKGGGDIQGPIEKDRWYEISLVLTKNSAEMLLDGKRVSRVEADALPAFFATAGYQQKDKTVVVKATNYNKKPMRVDVRIDGAKSVGAKGRHIVMRSEKPDDENTLDNPLRIVPQDQPLPGCGQRFTVMLAPSSINVLCIPAR